MSDLSSYYFTPVSEDVLGAMSDHDLAEWVNANWSRFRADFESFYERLPDEFKDRINMLDEGSSTGYAGRNAAGTDGWDGAVASDWSFEAVPAAAAPEPAPEVEARYDPVVSYSVGVPPARLADGWYRCEVDGLGVLIVRGHDGNEVERWYNVDGAERGGTGRIYVEDGQATSSIEWDEAPRPSWDLDPDSEGDEDSVVLRAAQYEAAVDWSQVRHANHDVVAAMVSKTARDDAKIVDFAMGGGYVLLGGEVHPVEAYEAVGWAAMQLGKNWARGTVRFKRNRLSPNEFVITHLDGDLDDALVSDVLKEHILDESIYQYPDADRVNIHRG